MADMVPEAGAVPAAAAAAMEAEAEPMPPSAEAGEGMSGMAAEPGATPAADETMASRVESMAPMDIGRMMMAGAAGMAAAEGAETESAPVVEEPGAADEDEGEDDAERQENAKMRYDLAYVEGIGQSYAARFAEIGITRPGELLEAGAQRRGREELAEKTGIPEKLILTWINHVDLFRIKGVGEEYADLLEASGVDTVPELATRNPENLHARIMEVNVERKRVRRPPALSMVESWVAQAKELPRVINY
jgi:predicted flap endonuclease-1-like 5' DNA nuclease